MRIEAGDGTRLFVKRNRVEAAELFAAEADGLRALATTGTFRVPRVVTFGRGDGEAWLVLEFIDIGDGDPAAFGECLAALHRHTGATFGWHRDNFIGSTPQINTRDADWSRFWRDQRLAPMIRRVADAGHPRLAEAGRRLCEAVPALLDGHRPPPALLHGDLWAGNGAYDGAGTPLVFDPAVYRGDPEADLAMTELFGGFPARFRSAYVAAVPPACGYGMRRELYNLYHVLNHAILFGGGYVARSERMISALLAESRA